MSVEQEIVNSSRVITVVGLSPNPERPSYEVVSYLKKQGYKVIPVNHQIKKVLGEISYSNLGSIP